VNESLWIRTLGAMFAMLVTMGFAFRIHSDVRETRADLVVVRRKLDNVVKAVEGRSTAPSEKLADRVRPTVATVPNTLFHLGGYHTSRGRKSHEVLAAE
jgi:hypothetical protein